VAIAAATPELAQMAQNEGRSARRVGGTSPTLLPRSGLAGTPRPGAILHTSWVNKMSVARRTALALASSWAGPKQGAAKSGPAEEALADQVADRRKLSGDVGCGDE
jgi:hypothetical protein